MKTTGLIVFLFFWVFTAHSQEKKKQESWQIDSIAIHKNWRTRDKIILRELQLKAGDTIDKKSLEKSINRVWNIGSFVQVDYALDSVSPKGHVLNLTARDAFNLVPYVMVSGNSDDKNLSMGFSDNNFLGRNIDLSLSGNIGTYKSSYNVSIGVPRQLLYKNMTLSFKFSSASGNNFRYRNNQKVSALAYRSKQFSGSIGNPWHTDYYYTFSPDFSWSLFQHKTDTSLIDTDIPFVDDYSVNYLALSIGESLGLINRIRHQRNGYRISGSYGMGIGLDKNSPTYQSFGFATSYFKTFNKLVELSAQYSTGYTTSRTPSLIHYMSSRDVKGIINGQESGQGNYNVKLNTSFTYLYTNWFALEHSIYTHAGMADDKYFRIYERKPRISVGTELRFWPPMIPWMALSVHFTYMKGNNNWFHLDI